MSMMMRMMMNDRNQMACETVVRFFSKSNTWLCVFWVAHVFSDTVVCRVRGACGRVAVFLSRRQAALHQAASATRTLRPSTSTACQSLRRRRVCHRRLHLHALHQPVRLRHHRPAAWLPGDHDPRTQDKPAQHALNQKLLLLTLWYQDQNACFILVCRLLYFG